MRTDASKRTTILQPFPLAESLPLSHTNIVDALLLVDDKPLTFDVFQEFLTLAAPQCADDKTAMVAMGNQSGGVTHGFRRARQCIGWEGLRLTWPSAGIRAVQWYAWLLEGGLKEERHA